MNKHVWIYLPITVIVLIVLLFTIARELTYMHQFRSLSALVSAGEAEVTPGYIQGVRRERTTRRGGYRNIAFVDYATRDERLTLKTRVSEDHAEQLYPGKRVSVLFHPEDPRIALMEGAISQLGWGRRLMIIFMTAISFICIQIIIYWAFNPLSKLRFDLYPRLK